MPGPIWCSKAPRHLNRYSGALQGHTCCFSQGQGALQWQRARPHSTPVKGRKPSKTSGPDSMGHESGLRSPARTQGQGTTVLQSEKRGLSSL